MKYSYAYTDSSREDFLNLDIAQSRRIAKKLRYFIEQPDPLKFAKALSGNLKGFFRFRIGDYRVIFKKDAQGQITILHIITIKHRKEVYE